MVTPGIVYILSVLYFVFVVYLDYVTLEILYIEIILTIVAESAYPCFIIVVYDVVAVSAFLDDVTSVKGVGGIVLTYSYTICIIRKCIVSVSCKQSYSAPSESIVSVYCGITLGVVCTRLSVIAYKSVFVGAVIAVQICAYRTYKCFRCYRIQYTFL